MMEKKTSSAEQIKKGGGSYTFETFLDQLWQDVESVLSEEHSIEISDRQKQKDRRKKNLRDVFVFVYELCYLAAMNQTELKRILDKSEGKNKEILRKTLKSNEENIALLHAIFMREISGKLQQGLTERQAVKSTVEESKRVFAHWKK
jgi:hypothetical protein